jgi:hypothetical protein
MKSFIVIAVIFFTLTLSFESCQRCATCVRNDLEAKCIKPNDTLVFDQDDSYTVDVHRYYAGGDSVYSTDSTFASMKEELRSNGYACSVYPRGHLSKQDICPYNCDLCYDQRIGYERAGYACKSP